MKALKEKELDPAKAIRRGGYSIRVMAKKLEAVYLLENGSESPRVHGNQTPMIWSWVMSAACEVTQPGRECPENGFFDEPFIFINRVRAVLDKMLLDDEPIIDEGELSLAWLFFNTLRRYALRPTAHRILNQTVIS